MSKKAILLKTAGAIDDLKNSFNRKSSKVSVGRAINNEGLGGALKHVFGLNAKNGKRFLAKRSILGIK